MNMRKNKAINNPNKILILIRGNYDLVKHRQSSPKSIELFKIIFIVNLLCPY